MICPRCHRALRPNARFCPYCGAKVVSTPVQQRPPRRTVHRPPVQQRPPPQSWGGRPVQQQVPAQPIRQPPQGWGQPQVRRRQAPPPQHPSGGMPVQQQPFDAKAQLGQNYKAIILKSFVERKMKDDKIDKADLNDIERRYAEFLEAKSRGQIPDPDDLAKLEFQFRQLHIIALRDLIEPPYLTDEDNLLLSQFDEISSSLDTLGDVASEAIKLPGELDLIFQQMETLNEALLDLKLLESEGDEYDLNSRDLAKIKRILVQFHRDLRAFISSMGRVSTSLSISLPPEIQLLDELDNFIQNLLLIEKVDWNTAMDKIKKCNSAKTDLENFMARLQKVAVETDVDALKLNIMKNPKNLALLEQVLETVRAAYKRQQKLKKKAAMKPYKSSLKKVEIASSPQLSIEEKENEKSVLPPLEPLPPLEELPELDPLQPFS